MSHEDLDDYAYEASGFASIKFSAQQALERASRLVGTGRHTDAIHDPRSYAKVNSPIERKLIAELLTYLCVSSYSYDTFILLPGEPFGVPRGQKLCMAPQHRVGRFIVDIAMQRFNGPKLAVECDGHDYHERTKDQAAYDRYRDRYIASRGWVIARFTGSEIYHDAYGCVQEIATLLEGEEID